MIRRRICHPDPFAENGTHLFADNEHSQGTVPIDSHLANATLSRRRFRFVRRRAADLSARRLAQSALSQFAERHLRAVNLHRKLFDDARRSVRLGLSLVDRRRTTNGAKLFGFRLENVRAGRSSLLYFVGNEFRSLLAAVVRHHARKKCNDRKSADILCGFVEEVYSHK